jgi:hypothetical protein
MRLLTPLRTLACAALASGLLLNYDPSSTAACDNVASVTVNGHTRTIYLNQTAGLMAFVDALASQADYRLFAKKGKAA